MTKHTVEEKLSETNKLYTEIRQDLKKSSDILDNFTKKRIFDLTRQDSLIKSQRIMRREILNPVIQQAEKKRDLK